MATSLLIDAPHFASLTSPAFDALAAASLSTILERQQALGAGMQPESFDKWQCDPAAGVLRFTNADGGGIEASAQLLGSYSPESQSWEWAWNNPLSASALTTSAADVRAYGDAHGYAALTTGIVRATEGESRGMIAVAAVIVGVQGIFWGRSGSRTVAMGYRDARRITPRSAARTSSSPLSGGSTARTASAILATGSNVAQHAPVTGGDASGDADTRVRFGNPFSWLLHMLSDPIVLKRSAPRPFGGKYVPLTRANEAFVAPEILDQLADTEASLARRGFGSPFRATNRVLDNITSVVSLLEHPGDRCIAFVLFGIGKRSRVTCVATFRTDFQDGVQLYTSNSRVVLRTPPFGTTDSVTFPDVSDAGALYDIHRARVADHTLRAATASLTRGVDPLAFVDAETRAVQESWIAKRYFTRLGDDRMTFTRRGAVLSAWRGLFPWRHLVEHQRARKRAEVVRHLGL